MSCERHVAVYCTTCYRDVPARTALQEAVLRAAVNLTYDAIDDDPRDSSGVFQRAVDALLADEPAWGEGK